MAETLAALNPTGVVTPDYLVYVSLKVFRRKRMVDSVNHLPKVDSPETLDGVGEIRPLDILVSPVVDNLVDVLVGVESVV